MNTTTRLWVGGFVVALGVQPLVATAGADGGGLTHVMGRVALGQTRPEDPQQDNNRKESDDLLRKARDAMRDNQFDKAEMFLSQAERLGARYGLFALGDTPLKVRRDLEAMRRGAQPAGPPASYGSPSGQETLPPRGPQAASKADCNRLLVAARQALAVGDARRARAYVRQAETMNVQYGVFEDAPKDVSASIDKFDKVMAERQTVGDSEGLRRRYSESLMDQAEALIKWNLLDDAERLCQDAQALGIRYNDLENSPEKMLGRVNSARKMEQDLVTAPEQPARSVAPMEPLPPVVQQPVTPPARPAGPSPQKMEATRLVNLACEAMSHGDLDRAEYFAKQAQQMNVEYGPTEFHPGMVLHDVQQARARIQSLPPMNTAAAPTSEPAMRPRMRVQTPEENAPRTVEALPPSQPMPPANNLAVRPSADPLPADYPRAPAREVTSLPPVAAPVQRPVAGPYGPPQDTGTRQAGYEQDPRAGNNQFATQPGPATAEAMRLLQAGDFAVEAGDVERAMSFFRQAYDMRRDLDPAMVQRLEDRLKFLPNMRQAPVRPTNNVVEQPAPVDPQQILARQIGMEIARAKYKAAELKGSDPRKGIEVLKDARTKVEASTLDESRKASYIAGIDRSLAELEQAYSHVRPRLELEERNAKIRGEMEAEKADKLDRQNKLAELVDQFNKLMDEERYREAEVVAKQAKLIMPDEPVVQSMTMQSRFVSNYRRAERIRSLTEQGFTEALGNVEESGIPFNDNNPYQFGDAKSWERLTKARKGLGSAQRMSAAELEIQQRLKSPVSLNFHQKPLHEVMRELGQLANVNISLDERGLREEAVLGSHPISIDLNQPISLKSALNLILEPLHLAYVVKHEVVLITSESMKHGELTVVTYNVADLVIPIPNFVSTGRLGLAAAYHDALSSMAGGPRGMGVHSPVTVMASKNGGNGGVLGTDALAQPFAGGMGGPPGAGAQTSPGGLSAGGPGGLGGGTQADFDSLISLITSTVAPDSWDEVGGRGSVREFETNLSLVISQTQDNHEKVADLLDQLRRLQDLQVTIEVRFITLNDNFFERIGVDFNFDIDDNQDRPFQVFGNVIDPNVAGDAPGNRDFQDRDHNNGTWTGGLTGPFGGGPPPFSSDLDIPFRQGSFSLAVPQFGGFAPGAGATLGFAILSDIEAYFFMEASQGDRRSNVLQAPKVTLFNGQVAFVADTSQSPFVISVIPVVGDFAAAFQPVIVVLSEGTFLSVQAVVSNDRRFVRLTLVPFFSAIGEVNEFTFTGSQTTTASSGNTSGNGGDDSSENENMSVTRSGTTVQLPTFAFVTVTTTVSVPDGGTVLLGGIKRLNEGRNEFGVPILSKVPYINRLFRNVGIGRETQSLMMMVTPRIIIQEEEEQQIGVSNASP